LKTEIGKKTEKSREEVVQTRKEREPNRRLVRDIWRSFGEEGRRPLAGAYGSNCWERYRKVVSRFPRLEISK